MNARQAKVTMEKRKAEKEALDVQADDLAVFLAQGGQVIAWAQKNKVPQRTAYRLSHTKECAARIAEIRHAVANRVVGHVSRHAVGAVKVIAAIMNSENAPETTRLAAAKVLLDRVADLSSWSGLECQIANMKRDDADHERTREETDQWCGLTG